MDDRLKSAHRAVPLLIEVSTKDGPLASATPEATARGPHRFFPQGWDREKLFDHIRRTHTPESLVGIVFTPPPLHVQHEKIGDFEGDPGKRPYRALVPCSLCSNGVPKFQRGSLLWSGDCFIRTIGNCCAAKFFAGLVGRDSFVYLTVAKFMFSEADLAHIDKALEEGDKE